jgi:hypothetical protein
VLFCNYVITVTMIGGPNELLQILPLLHFAYYTRCNSEALLTKRQLFSEDGPLCKKHYPYGGYLPQYSFVLTAALFFSVITPLVPLVSFFFFVSRYFVLRHQFLFVYKPQFSLGGEFWFELVHQVLQGLLLLCAAMILYTLLKLGFAQVAMLLPLPFVVWYQWTRLDGTLGKLCKDVAFAKAMQDQAPLSSAGAASSSEDCASGTWGDSGGSGDKTCFRADFYAHPALRAPIDAAPLPYRLQQQPLLAPPSCSSLCPGCSLVSLEVASAYLAPLQEERARQEEAVAPLVDVDFLDSSMQNTDTDIEIETDQSKSERIKYTIDYSY